MKPVARIIQSFNFKIAMLVTAMVMLAALGAGGVSLLIAETEMREGVARQQLSLLSSAAGHIDNDLKGKKLLLFSLMEEMRERGTAPGQVQRLLESREGLRGEFFNVTAFDVQGDLIASLNSRNARRINVAGRQYFKDTLAAREGVVSAPFVSALSGKPVIAITQPVEDEQGNVIMVLLGAIDLLRPSFSDYLDSLHRGQGYLFIVGADGTIIHHPDKTRVLTPLDPDGALGQAVLHRPEGWRDDVLDDDTPVLVAHTLLRKVDWTIAAVYPIRNAFAPMAAVRGRALAAASMITALAAFFGWVLTKALMQPLAHLRNQVESINSGVADIDVFASERRDEFGTLSRALHLLSRQRQEAQDAMQRLASTDPLTGANNRRMFDQLLPAAIARAGRVDSYVGLAFLDIDKFKQINDTYGHGVGDAVLVEFARRLNGAVRRGDTVARLAGDEFVIVFEQLGCAAEGAPLGDKIVEAMAAPFHFGDVGGPGLRVTTSVGIAISNDPSATPEGLMHAADRALYSVKSAGRNGYAINVHHDARVVALRRTG
ncbi:diguanylate cyclase (GGDEF) domain-containing protein [Duganella sp. CF517]|uniref:sensor domain-containing diguanylate cyclase n=1 Tax=Duganella sp. CF517 TaxID=1881038 RepID=UPI0008D27CC4|nr:sensor domain-containing diguanylate cyclase [Duganella sp. CF517]SEO57911.1 diguanylate cyclase (GGDEF) domain-containing protein [Duganella sp. CF517]